MAYSYNTTTKKITVTSSSSTRAMYVDVQTVFAWSTYMQYLMPMVWNIRDALYTFLNGWDLDTTTSLGYLYDGWLIDSAWDNKWTNAKTISGNDFTGIQLYYNQTWTPVNFGATWLINKLIKVRDAWADINAQAYTIYSRPYGSTYSQFTVTASSWWVDTIPLSVWTDAQVTLPQGTVDAYTDLSIAWATVYRSSFDGASTTKYTLNGAHTDIVTTITVNEAIHASVPSSWTLQIDGEVISYTGKWANTFTGCTRGTNRTTAVSHLASASLSTNMFQYSRVIKTTSGSRRLSEIYQWVQSQLTKATEIDVLTSGKIGKLKDSLVSYTGTMVTAQGVWVEWFSSVDNNSITYTDLSAWSHTSPLSVPVVVNIDTAIIGWQVTVFSLTTTGLSDATYTPANILATLINTTSSSEATSTSIIYTADVPVKVIVRKPWYAQFSLYTTITSSGLNVTSQNPVDTAY